MANGGTVSQDLAQEVFTDALRRHVGRGKPLSCEGLAEASCLTLRSVRGYHGGTATPGLPALLSLMGALPPSFANDLLILAGLAGAAPVEARAADSFRLNETLSGVVALLGRHLSDGKVDHVERQEELAAVKAALEVIHAFLSAESTTSRDGSVQGPTAGRSAS